MPKRTKKQKLKTSEHRAVEPKPLEQPHTFTYKASSPQKQAVARHAQDTFIYLRGDLLKTVVLAVICIGILITLSFVLK